MPDDELTTGEEPEINAVAVSLADLADDEIEEEEVPEEESAEPEKKEKGGGLDDLMDDIFADEQDDDDHLKAFGDLEQLTMVEVSSEVEAILEELQIRQGET